MSPLFSHSSHHLQVSCQASRSPPESLDWGLVNESSPAGAAARHVADRASMIMGDPRRQEQIRKQKWTLSDCDLK